MYRTRASAAMSVLKSFGITNAVADRYAGHWPKQAMQRHGNTLIASEYSKSELYTEVGPLFVNGLVSLVDDARLESNYVASNAF